MRLEVTIPNCEFDVNISWTEWWVPIPMSGVAPKGTEGTHSCHGGEPVLGTKLLLEAVPERIVWWR